jgi:3,4-dihydroxy 2-butanone 4-phosphate synthase/GTP cyclohydrolase II
MAGEICDRLDLPLMRARNEGHFQTQFTVSVDAVDGVSTGISAHDRAMTARLLADSTARAGDFARPGHVVPIRAHDGGLRARSGYAEAAVELCRRAGRAPAAVMSDIVSQRHPTEMAGRAELVEFARGNALALVRVDDLTRTTDRRPPRRLFDSTVPGRSGPIRLVGFARDDGDGTDGTELGYVVARAARTPNPVVTSVDVRVCCPLGAVSGDPGCSCVADLHAAVRNLPGDGSRAVFYVTRPAVEHRLLRSSADRVDALLADLGLRRLARRRAAEIGRACGIGSAASSTTEVPCQ